MSDTTEHTLMNDLGLLVVRAGAGLFMIIGHGWGKLMNFGEKASGFPDPLGIGNELSMAAAISAEVFAALLVVIGLGTRYASAALVFTMAVAAFIVHGGDPFGEREMALLYAVIFLALALTGAGKFSADHKISAMRKNK